MKALLSLCVLCLLLQVGSNYQVDDDIEEFGPTLFDDKLVNDDDSVERYYDPAPFRFRFRFRRPRFPRIRVPRIRVPRVRLPRVHIPGVRIRPGFRLPRIKIRTPRIRKLLPRIRIPRIGPRLTPRIRLRRLKVPGIRIFTRKPPPPPRPPTNLPQITQVLKPTTPSPCYLGLKKGCDKDWRDYDPYGFIEYFNASCIKYNVCHQCASMKDWNLATCQDQFAKDMRETVCNNIPDQFTKFVCSTQADKFYGFVKIQKPSVNGNSPDWCKSKCVDDFAKPF